MVVPGLDQEPEVRGFVRSLEELVRGDGLERMKVEGEEGVEEEVIDCEYWIVVSAYLCCACDARRLSRGCKVLTTAGFVIAQPSTPCFPAKNRWGNSWIFTSVIRSM